MYQWWRGYVFCALLILVGAYQILVPETFGDLRPNEEALARGGVTIKAIVTGKNEGQSRSLHSRNVAYAYQVNGRAYRGDASLTSDEYIRTTVGQGLNVVYLVGRPEVSDYRPDRWIANHSSPDAGGILFLIFGLLSLLTVAFVQYTRSLASKRPSRPSFELPVRRTYGAPLVVSVICVLFTVIGLAFQFQTIASIVGGQDVPIRSNLSGTYQTTAASPGTKVLLAFFPILVWGFGLVGLLYSKGYSVTTSPEGIEIRKFPGKVYHWRWEQIRTATRRHDRSGTCQYILGNGSEEVWVTTVDDQETLSAEIERQLAAILR